MGCVETFQLAVYNRLLQGFVLEFGHFAARSANHVVVCFVVVRTFVLRGVAELMLDYQSCIDKQDNRVVQRGAADPEFLFLRHIGIEHLDIEMSFDGINRIEYSIAFGRLAMSVLLQIVCQNLFYLFLYVLFHSGLYSASKVIFFM